MAWGERVGCWCAFEVILAADEWLLGTCRQALAMEQMPQCRPMQADAAPGQLMFEGILRRAGITYADLAT